MALTVRWVAGLNFVLNWTSFNLSPTASSKLGAVKSVSQAWKGADGKTDGCPAPPDLFVFCLSNEGGLMSSRWEARYGGALKICSSGMD